MCIKAQKKGHNVRFEHSVNYINLMHYIRSETNQTDIKIKEWLIIDPKSQYFQEHYKNAKAYLKGLIKNEIA